MALEFLIDMLKNRTRFFTINLFEADGVTEVLLASQDVVRIKIIRGDHLYIDLSSEYESSGTTDGSTVQFSAGTNVINVRISQGETADMAPGIYDFEINVVDASDVDATGAIAIKHVQNGTFNLLPSGSGPIDLDESSSPSSSSSSSSSTTS